MSGRAYRRLLQEKEKERMAKEIEAQSKSVKSSNSSIISTPEKSDTEESNGSSETESSTPIVSVLNPFDLLDAGNELEPSNAESTDEGENVSMEEEEESETSPAQTRKSKRQVKKKNKPKKDDITEEELDKMLQSLSLERKDLLQTPSNPSSHSPLDFLRLEAKHFNPENELVRVFGAQVIQQQQQEQQRQQHRHAPRRRPRLAFRKALLATPTDQWPPFESLGLTMDATTDSYYVYRHPPKFQMVQKQFQAAVATFHPDPLLNILALHPYHPDTLLMLSRILEQSGDRAQARDLLQRAIYMLEKSALASFPWTQPTTRKLSYLDYENRVLFLALFKNMHYLARDSCWRTALEWAKLLWSLEPEEDPLGCLFLMDYYAIQANAFDWLLQFIASIPNAWAYPNLAFGEAFAHFFLKNTEKATELILKACTLYPYIRKKLCLQPSGLPSHLSEELYVHRIEPSLLRNKALTDWVQSTLRSATPLSPADLSRPGAFSMGQLSSLYRHVLVSELHPSLLASLPDHVRAQTHYFDPYPPVPTRSQYPAMQTLRPGIPANANPIFGMFSSMLPWNNDVTAPSANSQELPLPDWALNVVGNVTNLLRELVPSNETQAGGTEDQQDDVED